MTPSIPAGAPARPGRDVGRDVSRDTRTALGLLRGMRDGRLDLRLPDGSHTRFGDGECVAVMRVHDEAVFTRVLARGDIGLAEAYLDAQWDSPDLTALLALLARHRGTLRAAVYGSWRALLAARLRHALNRNSRAGSRRNIVAHYDLGNDFYRAWLDETMSYSAALFDPAAPGDLALAQRRKYRRMLDRLAATPGQRVLEIGCGWGGFARMAVDDGLHVTGLTLSPAQRDWACASVPRADIQLRDYRDIGRQGERFDHVVSIEMFEAVGERYWPAYFDTVSRVLSPGGRAMIQSIVIRDDLFAAYRRGTDFIQQYVFPGGMLPSRAAFTRAANGAGLEVRDAFAFGRDYARTLALWREAFDRNWPRIAAQGFDERFRRLWRLYLCYCEAGFLAGNIDVVQFELRRG